MHRTPWIVAALALAACAPRPETPEQAQARRKAETDSAKVALQAAETLVLGYLAAGKADSAARFYTEDATYTTAGAPTARGRAAVQATFERLLGMGHWTIAVTPESVEASGPVAVEFGRSVISFAPGPHAPPGLAGSFPDTGAYLFTWRKVGGAWLIANDINVSTRAPGRKK